MWILDTEQGLYFENEVVHKHLDQLLCKFVLFTCTLNFVLPKIVLSVSKTLSISR